MPNLTQYQIAPPPTKVEYDTLMGSATLSTTDKTIKGAINEVNAKCSVTSAQGYYKFPDGTLINYGTYTLAEWMGNVTFAQGFVNTNYSVTVTHVATAGETAAYGIAKGAKTHFTLYGAANKTVCWMAIGRWK